MATDTYRSLTPEERFRDLLELVVPLDMGDWRKEHVTEVLAGLGWELSSVANRGPRDEVRFQTDFVHGPRQGTGTLVTLTTAPDQATKLVVCLGDGINYSDDMQFMRRAWELVEEILGEPATVWSGRAPHTLRAGSWDHRWEDRGPRLLWSRPGTSLAVRHDCGTVTLELVCTGLDGDAGGASMSPSVWRATEPNVLPAPRRTPPAGWDGIQRQLADALQALCADASYFPGDFILHLKSGSDPLRFVSAWNRGLDLHIESFAHNADLADHDHLTQLGWQRHGDLWQRLFHNAMNNTGHADTAAGMLVDALRTLDVDLADLTFQGEIGGRGRLLELDLPHLAARRMPPEPTHAGGAEDEVGMSDLDAATDTELVELATRIWALRWPWPLDEMPALAAAFGWTVKSRHEDRVRLDIGRGLASGYVRGYKGETREIELAVTGFTTKDKAGRKALDKAFARMTAALTSAFGEPTRRHPGTPNEARWAGPETTLRLVDSSVRLNLSLVANDSLWLDDRAKELERQGLL